MALRTQCIHRLDDNRFPPMGPWKTCVLLTLPSRLAPDRRFTIWVAGSGKSIIWLVIFLLIIVTSVVKVRFGPVLCHFGQNR
jgi:hypothetical protein